MRSCKNSLSRALVMGLAATTAAASAGVANAGQFMDGVPDAAGFVATVDTNVSGRNGYKQLGSVAFGDSVAYTRASSRTTGVVPDGDSFATIRTFGWVPGSGRTRHDNPIFGHSFPCMINGYSMTVDRLGNGRGNVRLDFTFSPAVNDLKVMLFDIDEGSRSYPEKINLSASNADAQVYSNLDWDTVAQGDLTMDYDRAANVHLSMPRVYVPNRGPNLVIESRTYANENRDFTILQLPESKPVKQLRVQFVGSAIGAHAYVALYRGNLGQCD